MRRTILSLVLVCAVFFGSCPAAFAAGGDAYVDHGQNIVAPLSTNWFSGGTGTLNTISGRESEHDPISSGSVPDRAGVTDVEVRVTVSRGSIPFYLTVISPDGESASRYVSASTTLSFDEFDTLNPKGTWYIYICNDGELFTDVSTASARMTVTYSY